ncbi:MAG: 3-phenylpropionate/cinnamic acid dioxygenase subunit beta, partial [Bowdeniella nasicola]|nr:3-phenylpropionate/cinnamic acid dioxygenase subunit beta [Bowdeniella nasicola]
MHDHDDVEAEDNSTGDAHVTPVVDAEIERALARFLYNEAEMVDDMRWDDWITMLSEDLYYWAPVRENRVYRERKFETCEKGTSVYFEESKDYMRQRVYRLQTAKAWAEEPASRSRHLVSNVRVDMISDRSELRPELQDKEAYYVKSNFLVYRSRGERDQDHIAGERRDIIVRDAGGPWGWLLAEREIRFDQATILVKNLSLFY